MKFDDVNREIDGIPYMGPERGRQVYDHLIEHQLGRVLELGFFHGKSTCYLAAAVDELGGDAHVITMDKASAVERDPNIHQLLEKTGLTKRVTPVFAEASFTWELMKLLEQDPRPRFDFVYLDGGHTWDVTGFAYFLVDQLLEPGGWLLFDDLDWTIAKAAKQRELPRARRLPEEQRTTAQVRKVFELLVRPNPQYVEVHEDGNWGWARKRRDGERSGASGTDRETQREQGAAPAELPADRNTATTMRPLPLDLASVGPIRPKRSMARCDLEAAGDGVRCTLRARRGLRSNQVRYGGVRLPVTSPRGVRLELGLDDIENVKAVHVDAMAGNRRVGRWTWFPAEGRPASKTATFVLRPGMQNEYFRAVDLDQIRSAKAIEVVVAVRTGRTAQLRIMRAAGIG